MHPHLKEYLDAVDALLFDAVEKAFSISENRNATTFIQNFSANLKTKKSAFNSDEFNDPLNIKIAYKLALDQTISSDPDCTKIPGKMLSKILDKTFDHLYSRF